MFNQDDDQTLIQRALDADLEAFNLLVLRYQNRVYTVAYRIMGDGDSAADAAQDAFLTAYRKLASYRGGSFEGWLTRIVSNLCYDELRRRQRRPADYIEEMPGSEYDDGPPLPADAPTPEQVAQQNDLERALQDCIMGLKDDQRMVLVLSDVQGMSYQEVADNLDINLGTVKSRLSRARLAVRRCLQAVQELLPAEYRLLSDD